MNNFYYVERERFFYQMISLPYVGFVLLSFKCKQKLLNPKIIFVAKRIAIHEMLLKIVFPSYFLPQYFFIDYLLLLLLYPPRLNLLRIFPFAQLFHVSLSVQSIGQTSAKS